jgi:NAD(P)-dependent dehydrogenase (short-subunit alcohol dehydrogenase family)
MNKIADFTNKTVLVTGGSMGIGKAIAVGFAKSGANIVLCSRNIVKETEKELLGLGASTLSLSMDVTIESSVEHAVVEAIGKFGNIDILVNNAGNFSDGVVRKMSKDVWDNVIDVNLNGVFNCTKVVLSKDELYQYLITKNFYINSND